MSFSVCDNILWVILLCFYLKKIRVFQPLNIVNCLIHLLQLMHYIGMRWTLLLRAATLPSINPSITRRDLPNPLITYELYDKFADAVTLIKDDEKRLIRVHDAIQQLPLPHYRFVAQFELFRRLNGNISCCKNQQFEFKNSGLFLILFLVIFYNKNIFV